MNLCFVVFVSLIHVPLASISIIFTFLTGMTAWLLDKETKFALFLSIQKTVQFIVDLFTAPKTTIKSCCSSKKKKQLFTLGSGLDLMEKNEYEYARLARDDRTRYKNIVDWVSLAFFMYIAMSIHFIYSNYLPNVLVSNHPFITLSFPSTYHHLSFCLVHDV